MPAAVYNDPDRKTPYYTTKGLEYNPNWRLVFFNNKQKIFVDCTTPQGRALYEGIRTGKTLYPDDFSKNLILAHDTLLISVNQLEQERRRIQTARNTLQTKLKKQKEQIEKEKKTLQTKSDTEDDAIKVKEKMLAESQEKLTQLSEQLKTVQKLLRDTKKQGLDFAIKAFNLNPSPVPMMEIVFYAARYAELRPHITNFCKNYFDTFVENQKIYLKQDGYRFKVLSAQLAGNYLEQVARGQKDTKLADFYAAKTEQYLSERDRLFKKW